MANRRVDLRRLSNARQRSKANGDKAGRIIGHELNNDGIATPKRRGVDRYLGGLRNGTAESQLEQARYDKETGTKWYNHQTSAQAGRSGERLASNPLKYGTKEKGGRYRQELEREMENRSRRKWRKL